MAAVEECLISDPGKVILHGEHAIVHGKVALSVSLNLRTYLRLLGTSAAEASISLSNMDTFLRWDVIVLKPLLSQCKETDELVVRDVMEELKQAGFDCWETSVGAPGVLMHSPTSLKHRVLHILTKY